MRKSLILILGLILSVHIMAKEKQLKYLALGDSYTIGESVSEQNRWPELFVKELNNIGLNYSAPKIIAKTGWTTDELKAAIDKENIKETFDLVTLSIGVNNQYRGRDVEEFKIQFTELLKMAISFADNKPKKVIVLSIPDWGLTPFAKDRDKEKITREIKQYNTAKKEICNNLNITFINITDQTKLVDSNVDLLAKDGLHYSGKMHQLWVNKIIKILYN